MASVVSRLRSRLRRLGYDIVRYYPHRDAIGRLVRLCNDYHIDVFLDVGANEGQFGSELLSHGYTGQIASIEPLSAAHQKLSALAARHKRWLVAPRMAAGSASGNASINVASNSQSSSLLPNLERLIAAAPEARYVATEDIPVVMLDDFVERHFSPRTRLALKLDVQGYEHEILKGVARNLARVDLIHIEMSLSLLYAGSMLFADSYRWFVDRGYHCVALTPVFIDPKSWEMLQVDGTFVRARDGGQR